MNNYSNFCRDLKQDFIAFLNDFIFKIIKSRPLKKFILDMLYGLLKTGSTFVSEISRALLESTPLIYTEKRLTDNLFKYDLWSIDITKNILSSLGKLPITINVDESDIIKPYGVKFEDLSEIHDGSREGRPKEKGYNVTSVVAIGLENTVIPLVLDVYSNKTNEKNKTFITGKTNRHLQSIYSNIDEKIMIVLDRGYDGHTYLNPIANSGNFFVVRCKENRKYRTTKGNETIVDICKRIKGKYTSSFTHSNGKVVIQKFTSIQVKHKDFKCNLWLVVESVMADNDKRVYLTNIDCSTKDNCLLVLKSYRMRWRIEEFFRFIKGEYSFEKFRVRSLRAINNIAFIISLATIYITHLVITKNNSYYNCLESYKSFGDKYNEDNVISKYGTAGLELYRIKRGIQEILSHSKCLPKVPGRDRTKKEKYHQLSIFEIKF